MEKRKWLLKKKPSERSNGESERSCSISSHSERFSDDQVDGRDEERVVKRERGEFGQGRRRRKKKRKVLEK
ncbi:Filament-like plant protein 3 [Linum perenne]